MKKMIADEDEMVYLGKKLALATEKSLSSQYAASHALVIELHGSLGAGKTTLARGFLQGLSWEEFVKSPTYSLVESYKLPTCTVNHFDFYRLRDVRELEAIGIEEYFLPRTICLIEWPEISLGFLPKADLSCYIKANGNGREVEMVAHTEVGKTILKRIHHE